MRQTNKANPLGVVKSTTINGSKKIKKLIKSFNLFMRCKLIVL